MRENEKRKAFELALREQQRKYGRLRVDSFAALTALLEEALAEIERILLASPTDFQTYLLPQINGQVESILKSVGIRASDLVGGSIGDAWEIGIQSLDAPLLAAGVGVSAVLPAVDARQLLNVQHFVSGKIQGITTEMANKITTQIGLNVMGVQPVSDSLNNIKAILGDADKERALKIVRTEMGRVYSISQHQRVVMAKQHLPDLQKQWRRSGKLHARPTHVLAHGQVRNVDEPFNVGGVLMMHPHDPTAPAKEVINCGCTSVPHMARWDNL